MLMSIYLADTQPSGFLKFKKTQFIFQILAGAYVWA